MSRNQNVPQVRFKGFTDAWEQRELCDIADIVGGGTPSTSNPDYWDGEIDWYAPAEIADQIYISSSTRKITKQGYENSSAKMLPVGTVLFTSRAGIGKTAILRKEGCTNQGFQSIVPHKNELDSYFIFSRTEELKRYGETIGAGSTFVEVSGKQMANMGLMMPKSIEEQQIIGAYFQSLDNLITLHQRKCDSLKKTKKAMLQKMFPKNGESVPEIRFKGFTDAWEQRELGEHLIKNNERNKELTISNVESVSNKKGFVKQTEQFEDYSVASSDLSNYYIIRENMFAYNPSRINVGSIAYKEKGDDIAVVSPLYVSFATKNIDDKYLWYWFKTSSFEQQRQVSSEGGVRDTLSFDKVNSMQIALPSVAEQQQIGTYFRNLDNHITLHQRKLETLKKLKKSMLQKMFV